MTHKLAQSRDHNELPSTVRNARSRASVNCSPECCSFCLFQYYLLTQPRVRATNGSRLIHDIKLKMEKMIQKRVEAVRVRSVDQSTRIAFPTLLVKRFRQQ